MLFERPAERKYLVGIDLRDDYCQISWLENPGHNAPKEPTTFSLTPGEDRYNIPMALCKAIGANKWFAGMEASLVAGEGNGIYIPKVLSLALAGDPVEIEGNQYDPVALLALYVKRVLDRMSSDVQPTEIAALTFTVRDLTSRMVEVLDGVHKRLDLGAQVYYEGYANSFYNYMLMQAKVLREPASILAEYESGGQLRICKLSFNEKTRPIVAYRTEQVYPDLEEGLDPKAMSVQDYCAAKDEKFRLILEGEIGTSNYSSAWLIGTGFQGDWMRQSIAYLCRGRRGFMGINLYSKGAAYGALFRLTPPEIVGSYYFLDDNKLRSNVGMNVLVRGQEQYVALVDAGVNYYEVDHVAEIVVEDGNELYLLLTPLTGESASNFLIRLEGLPMRDGRAARIRMHFTMTAPDKMHVELTDLGFGEIFPSTGMRWEQDITLNSVSI